MASNDNEGHAADHSKATTVRAGETWGWGVHSQISVCVGKLNWLLSVVGLSSILSGSLELPG